MNASEKRLSAGALSPIASAYKTSGVDGARSLSVAHAADTDAERFARQERENDVGLVGEEVARKRGSDGPAAEAAGARLVRYHRTCS
jgi:hypothetical protein